MSLLMEPGQTYNSWDEFKSALDTHSKENKVIFNIANAKTVEQSNAFMKRGPLYQPRLKYSHCVLQCKHFGSYQSSSAGLRPKQRSYKIDCRAFISISACRKEDYLIIRDSYHKHSHPCTDEIYNSYPEVRRMTKDERRMVGTLMNMGVPASQIKSAVGKNVTPKDLHNAKNHIRAVRMGLKSDEPKSRAAVKRNAVIRDKEDKLELIETGDIVIESCDNTDISTATTTITTSSTTTMLSQTNDKPTTSQGDIDSGSEKSESTSNNLQLNANENAGVGVADDSFTEEKSTEETSSETNSVSNILSTLNSTESVIAVANNDETDGDKTSYTVIVSTGEDNQSSTEVVASLQEIFQRLQTEGLPKTTPTTIKVEKKKIWDHIQEQSDGGQDPSKPGEKNCDNCSKYMSPLDGHSMCLACLGPQHLHQEDCVHCGAMKPEQLNIRRKLLVRMRMKALKELNETKRQGGVAPDSPVNDSALYTPRKSKRVRKPKDFGPDMAVHTVFSTPTHKVSSKPAPKVTKCVVNDGEKEYMVEIPKREVEDDYSSYSLEVESPPPSSSSPSSQSQNTGRFSHLLKQTEVFEDVVLHPSKEGMLGYEPDVNSVLEITKGMSQPDLPAVPVGLDSKYSLDEQFESSYCSVPSNLDVRGDPVVNSMGSGLHKLAQNATVQTRLAIYDKLFTRLGVGMADEALDILSQLYGKVMNVTEISQEDLTNDLQTALDTIQALKDVLEELGVMSKDALSTAVHQRSISINSLDKAKKSLKRPLSNSFDTSSSNTKRRKFEPFTKNRLTTQLPGVSESHSHTSHTISDSVCDTNNTPHELKFEVHDNDHAGPSNSDHDELNHDHIVMEVTSLPTEISPTVLTTPVMNVSPMTLSSELLERLQNKEGVIQLNMAKEHEILLNSSHTTDSNTVEIQRVTQQPQTETSVSSSGETE